jgi:hypothetical protein
MREVESRHVQSQGVGVKAVRAIRISVNYRTWTHLDAKMFEISLLPTLSIILSSHFSTDSSPTLRDTCLIASSRAGTELGLGFVNGMAASSSSASPVVPPTTLLATDPLDLDGSGNKEVDLGEDGPEPKSPFEIRRMVPGLREEGLAETGNKPGDVGV